MQFYGMKIQDQERIAIFFIFLAACVVPDHKIKDLGGMCSGCVEKGITLAVIRVLPDAGF